MTRVGWPGVPSEGAILLLSVRFEMVCLVSLGLGTPGKSSLLPQGVTEKQDYKPSD